MAKTGEYIVDLAVATDSLELSEGAIFAIWMLKVPLYLGHSMASVKIGKLIEEHELEFEDSISGAMDFV